MIGHSFVVAKLLTSLIATIDYPLPAIWAKACPWIKQTMVHDGRFESDLRGVNVQHDITEVIEQFRYLKKC